MSPYFFRRFRSNYLSATKKGTVNLNVNLIKAHQHIIDNVVSHELCHFIIREHSYRFWNLLKKYFPDYPKYVEWLTSMERIYSVNKYFQYHIVL